MFLEQALARCSEVGAALRARVLSAVADWAFYLDDFERAETLAEQSLVLYRELGDSAGVAVSLSRLGSITCTRGRYGLGRAQLEEAAELFQGTGDRWQRSSCFSELARAVTEQGQYERARALLNACILNVRNSCRGSCF